MERFKGRFTYTLIFCILGESFSGGGGGGGGGGGDQNHRIDFENLL